MYNDATSDSFFFSFFRPSCFNRRERERESERDVSCDVSDDDETMKTRTKKLNWKSSDKNLITEQTAVVRIITKETTRTRDDDDDERFRGSSFSLSKKTSLLFFVFFFFFFFFSFSKNSAKDGETHFHQHHE